LGGFIGPTVAGILYDLCGFRWATQFVSGSFIVLVIKISRVVILIKVEGSAGLIKFSSSFFLKITVDRGGYFRFIDQTQE
jgi:hypothetical protein